ncbi:hypothetical protein KAR91_46630, partial [Candidatus Pacearchaeota archaeon]|nr:hypothetical protein [Candidatus Pacearchaeota archaeon]
MSNKELQSEDNTDASQNETDEIIVDPPEGSELAPDAEKPAEKDSEEDPTIAVINKKHFEKMQAERERDAVQLKLDDSNRQLEELQGKQNQPVPIPEMPDQYDDDFDAKLKQRDEAIRRNAEITAQVAVNTQNQQNAQ